MRLHPTLLHPTLPPSRRRPALATALLLVLAAAPPSRAGSGEDRAPDVPAPAERCVSCHALGPDEPVLEGPTLWGVVGRPVASVPGFEYSGALRALGGTWTRERLDRFLTAPQAFAPGTLMELGGVRSAADRAVVLDFLETLRPGASASPPASPSPSPSAAPAGGETVGRDKTPSGEPAAAAGMRDE